MEISHQNTQQNSQRHSLRNSLRAKVLLLLLTLILIISIQAYTSWDTRQQLGEGRERLEQTIVAAELVYQLERDVLDLQRNVLIYKISGNESAAARFDKSSSEVQLHLDELSLLTRKTPYHAEYADYLNRLEGHLKDYGQNFLSVVESKSEQKRIQFEDVPAQIASIKKKMASSEIDFEKYFHLTSAERAIYQYLVEPDFEDLKVFKAELSLVKNSTNDPFLKEMLEDLSKSFTRLAQLTRGYVFLVNVVMAGSANEFLFLTKEMIDIASQDRKAVKRLVSISEAEAATRNNIISLVCIALVMFLATMIITSIITPIQRITKIFGRIIAGEEVENIPGIEREDEVGQLSQAAGIFYDHSLVQRRLNEKLRLETQRAEQATIAKNHFLANMSHEIRTPVNGILGLIQLCQRTTLTDTQREYLGKAVECSKVLMGVINDVLDFSKIEAGKLVIENAEFDFDIMLRQVLAPVQVRAVEKQLNLRLFVDERVKVAYLGDPLRISQILLNILNNAVKFTDTGSITIEIKLAFEEYGAQRLIFAITDTGIGMNEEQLTSVFNAFSQADESTSRKFGGPGLGLSIVTQLITLMNGEIQVTSAIGKGSSFRITLPLTTTETHTRLIEPIQDDLENILVTSSLVAAVMIPYLPAAMNFSVSARLDTVATSPDHKNRVVVGIDTLAQAIDLLGPIEQLISEGNSVGFAIDTNPAELKQQLLDHFDLPVLEQPAPPSSLMAFLKALSPHSPPKKDISTNERDELEELDQLDQLDQLQQFLGHVLLVDDNAINRMVASDMLDEFGVTCDIAENGQQAVDNVNGGKPYDLVLMDVQMPVMDGYEATQELRLQGHKELKICGLSANVMRSDIDKAMENGMDDYMTKPIAWDDLEKTLQKYLVRQATAPISLNH
ncbi:MAG: signal transduction histidine kinase/CheY-like chemotaxis protein [Candidatus Azotimanducaceae bacterium]